MLSLLTYPSYSKRFNAYKNVKERVKQVMNRASNNYFGHYGVNRSLTKGLNQLEVAFNFNPTSAADIGDHVHVLAGTYTLEAAIELKEKGKVKRLTAGPNVVEHAGDCNGLVANPAVDLYLINSPWVEQVYLRDNPALEGRLGCWPAGVDVGYWQIEKPAATQKQVLFFIKTTDPLLVAECEDVAARQGYKVDKIYYGKFTHSDLRTKLRDAGFVVYFQDHESQGIALYEIWSTNTPTFVWNPGYWLYRGKVYRSSSAPYLTSETGCFFRDANEFENIFTSGKANASLYNPRKWVLDNGSDKVSARIFLNEIQYDINR